MLINDNTVNEKYLSGALKEQRILMAKEIYCFLVYWGYCHNLLVG